MGSRGRLYLLLAGVLAVGLGVSRTDTVQGQNAPKKKIEFNRDIRPILSNNCFVCHGPDKNLRKADLRLDDAKYAFEDRGGYKIIVPGSPEKSELYKRITAH